jgi:hypothetical protein
MVTNRQKEKIRPVKQIKRRTALREMWLDLFDECLNIPSCSELPSWSRINAFMRQQLASTVGGEMGVEWRRALERYNSLMRGVVAGEA